MPITASMIEYHKNRKESDRNRDINECKKINELFWDCVLKTKSSINCGEYYFNLKRCMEKYKI